MEKDDDDNIPVPRKKSKSYWGSGPEANTTSSSTNSSSPPPPALAPVESHSGATFANGSMRESKGPFARRIWDSFKRDPNAQLLASIPAPNTAGGDNGKKRTFDTMAAAEATAGSPLSRQLKGRHLQMIAIGGSIGTGLFVGSGKALATGGPASLLIAYGLIGGMLYCTVHALGEMAVLFPVAGSFAAFSTRFLDPAWGFAMGWNYALQWLVVLPLEIVSASITIDFWGSKINNSVWVAIFLVLIICINFFGVAGYGEAEFVFAIVKVVAIIGWIILAIVMNVAGGPGGTYIGGKYWRHPGAINNGFKGVCSNFVTSAFAFAGTELVGLAAAETANPRKSLPTAIKQVFWRITIFYVVSLLLVGLLIPYDTPTLLNGKTSADAKASPFVIAIENAGIEVLPSIMNCVIMVAVLSVGNSSIYGSSRTLAALAEQGQAPKFLAYIDRKGRPLFAVILASSVGLLAFLAVSNSQQDAFNWMLALSGLSSIFTWGSICLSHIRFRRAWAQQGHSLDELAFTSQAGVIGSWVGFIINVLVLIAQFWTGFAPVGYAADDTKTLVIDFFQAYLAAPIVVLFYVFYKLRFRTKIVALRDMDLVTGRRELDIRQLLKEERAEKRRWPRWKRWYRFFC